MGLRHFNLDKAHYSFSIWTIIEFCSIFFGVFFSSVGLRFTYCSSDVSIRNQNQPLISRSVSVISKTWKCTGKVDSYRTERKSKCIFVLLLVLRSLFEEVYVLNQYFLLKIIIRNELMWSANWIVLWVFVVFIWLAGEHYSFQW